MEFSFGHGKVMEIYLSVMEYLCIPTGEWVHADDLDHLS